jgi:hypothetical protein
LGLLPAATIGALRKRGFLTPAHRPIEVNGQQRAISLVTEKGLQARKELAELEAVAPGEIARWAALPPGADEAPRSKGNRNG